MTSPSPEFVALRDRALVCIDCGLSETRTNVVFGVGDVGARLMLVGEAPGKNEDLQGEPFVGAAGALLDELLAGIGISRDLVYIANVLKCRPPGNRDPRLDEIEACKGYLREQIRMIRPEVVVTLGNFATKLLLRTETGITRLRGQRFKWWMGATLVPTFHPAAALRGRPQVRADMEADFQTVKAILDETSDSMPPSPPTAGLGPAASAAVSPPVERGEYRAEPGEGGTFDDDEVDQLELFS
ncbi:MAG: uracil-DNA glycosylase [Acidimicrobiia bacterium]|nr:uracil-DNA glycosylase [Acidimicrobiia bacterium]